MTLLEINEQNKKQLKKLLKKFNMNLDALDTEESDLEELELPEDEEDSIKPDEDVDEVLS